MNRTAPMPLHLVVSSEDGLYVVGGVFHARPDADMLATMLRDFVVVRLDPPAPEPGGAPLLPFVCQLEAEAVRAFELEPGMGAHVIVRRHGPSDVVWATGEAAARDAARDVLAGADSFRAPAFVAESERLARGR